MIFGGEKAATTAVGQFNAVYIVVGRGSPAVVLIAKLLLFEGFLDGVGRFAFAFEVFLLIILMIRWSAMLGIKVSPLTWGCDNRRDENDG